MSVIFSDKDAVFNIIRNATLEINLDDKITLIDSVCKISASILVDFFDSDYSYSGINEKLEFKHFSADNLGINGSVLTFDIADELEYQIERAKEIVKDGLDDKGEQAIFLSNLRKKLSEIISLIDE